MLTRRIRILSSVPGCCPHSHGVSTGRDGGSEPSQPIRPATLFTPAREAPAREAPLARSLAPGLCGFGSGLLLTGAAVAVATAVGAAGAAGVVELDVAPGRVDAGRLAGR